MIIKKITVGGFAVNNYIVIDEATKDAVIIDAGGEVELVFDILEKYSANLKYILNTHGHFDHITSDYELQEATGAMVLIHGDDEYLIPILNEQLEMFNMPKSTPPKNYQLIEDNQEITVGEMNFKVLHTPGHTPGGVSYLIEDTLFAGDTLFLNAVGRTDLPKGDFEQLRISIKNKLFALPNNVNVLPGHGVSTTIGNEKKFNPYVGKNAFAWE